MFIVIELQKNANGTVSNIVTAHETYEAAQSKYHLILSAAAISNIPIHSATILRDDGFQLAYESFDHITPEPVE